MKRDENDKKKAGRMARSPLDGTRRISPPAAPPAATADAAPVPLDVAAPTLADAYGVAQLARDRERTLIELGSLPSWPGGMAPGHGWGDDLDACLGYGVSPGEMTVLGASSAGAGKTAWLMQIADGCALRCTAIEAGSEAYGPQLTPVIMASEMGANALTWRSLARWTGFPAYIFRGGATVEHRRKHADAASAWQAARIALDGPLGAARRWQRLIEPAHAGAAVANRTFVDFLQRHVEAWRAQIAQRHASREVVPIVVVDPTQRYQGSDDAVGALNDLARALCDAAVRNGWVVLLTSDTNKESSTGKAGGNDRERGANAIRGSYNLQHEVTNALYLQSALGPSEEQSASEKEKGERDIEVVVVKNRWGPAHPPWPRYIWRTASLRFEPIAQEEARSRDASRAASRDAAVPVESKKSIAKKRSAPRGIDDDES